ncbi:hypothetical protein [Vulcanisaeta sp. JCM 14467]|nr:hypothetical protein [Vulcanisaeta sp. JCM 14467]
MKVLLAVPPGIDKLELYKVLGLRPRHSGLLDSCGSREGWA